MSDSILKRNEQIIKMFSDENNLPTLQQVADQFGLTRERVRQILKKHNITKRAFKPIDYEVKFSEFQKYIFDQLSNGIIPSRAELNDKLGFAATKFISEAGLNGFLPQLLITQSNDKYSDEELICFLQKFYKQHGKISITHYIDNCSDYPSANTITSRFGSWNNALILAGIEVNKALGERSHIEDNLSLFEEYARYCIKNNVSPSMLHCINYGNDYATAIYRLRSRGTKWAEIISSAILAAFKQDVLPKGSF